MFNDLVENAKVVVEEIKLHPKESLIFIAKVMTVTTVMGVAAVALTAVLANQAESRMNESQTLKTEVA